MKPGHTVYFRNDYGDHVKAVTSIGVQFDHKRKDHAIEASILMEMEAFGIIDVIDSTAAEVKRHEQQYMNKNSKLYDRHPK